MASSISTWSRPAQRHSGESYTSIPKRAMPLTRPPPTRIPAAHRQQRHGRSPRPTPPPTCRQLVQNCGEAHSHAAACIAQQHAQHGDQVLHTWVGGRGAIASVTSADQQPRSCMRRPAWGSGTAESGASGGGGGICHQRYWIEDDDRDSKGSSSQQPAASRSSSRAAAAAVATAAAGQIDAGMHAQRRPLHLPAALAQQLTPQQLESQQHQPQQLTPQQLSPQQLKSQQLERTWGSHQGDTCTTRARPYVMIALLARPSAPSTCRECEEAAGMVAVGGWGAGNVASALRAAAPKKLGGRAALRAVDYPTQPIHTPTYLQQHAIVALGGAGDRLDCGHRQHEEGVEAGEPPAVGEENGDKDVPQHAQLGDAPMRGGWRVECAGAALGCRVAWRGDSGWGGMTRRKQERG